MLRYTPGKLQHHKAYSDILQVRYTFTMYAQIYCRYATALQGMLKYTTAGPNYIYLMLAIARHICKPHQQIQIFLFFFQSLTDTLYTKTNDASSR